jgi:hypothetical protein
VRLVSRDLVPSSARCAFVSTAQPLAPLQWLWVPLSSAPAQGLLCARSPEIARLPAVLVELLVAYWWV